MPYATLIEGYFEKKSFAAERSRFRTLLASISGIGSEASALFQPDLARLGVAWDAVLHASDPESRSTRLGVFLSELFSGVTVLDYIEHRDTGLGRTCILYRMHAIPGSHFQEWGDRLLVQCNSRSGGLHRSDVEEFVQILAGADTRVGVMVSAPGEPGDREGLDLQTRDAFVRRRRIIIILDGSDMERVLDGEENLYELLYRRYTQVTS
jgi:hypothetical protein